MTIEITSTWIKDGIVEIEAIDCSEQNLDYLMRNKTDSGYETEVKFLIDTKDKKAFTNLRRWMLKQDCVAGKKTWGDALASLLGKVTDSSGIGQYRVWER